MVGCSLTPRASREGPVEGSLNNCALTGSPVAVAMALTINDGKEVQPRPLERGSSTSHRNTDAGSLLRSSVDGDAASSSSKEDHCMSYSDQGSTRSDLAARAGAPCSIGQSSHEARDCTPLARKASHGPATVGESSNCSENRNTTVGQSPFDRAGASAPPAAPRCFPRTKSAGAMRVRSGSIIERMAAFEQQAPRASDTGASGFPDRRRSSAKKLDLGRDTGQSAISSPPQHSAQQADAADLPHPVKPVLRNRQSVGVSKLVARFDGSKPLQRLQKTVSNSCTPNDRLKECAVSFQHPAPSRRRHQRAREPGLLDGCGQVILRCTCKVRPVVVEESAKSLLLRLASAVAPAIRRTRCWRRARGEDGLVAPALLVHSVVSQQLKPGQRAAKGPLVNITVVGRHRSLQSHSATTVLCQLVARTSFKSCSERDWPLVCQSTKRFCHTSMACFSYTAGGRCSAVAADGIRAPQPNTTGKQPFPEPNRLRLGLSRCRVLASKNRRHTARSLQARLILESCRWAKFDRCLVAFFVCRRCQSNLSASGERAWVAIEDVSACRLHFVILIRSNRS